MLWFINGTLVETLLIILMMGYLDCKEIQAVHSKGDQPGDFFGRNDAEAETPVLWPSHAKSWLIGKDSDAGRDWGQEEKGTTEDEMAGWHHQLDGFEFEWTPRFGDGQRGLACCSSWGCKKLDRTELLNRTLYLQPLNNGTQKENVWKFKLLELLNLKTQILFSWTHFKSQNLTGLWGKFGSRVNQFDDPDNVSLEFIYYFF